MLSAWQVGRVASVVQTAAQTPSNGPRRTTDGWKWSSGVDDRAVGGVGHTMAGSTARLRWKMERSKLKPVATRGNSPASHLASWP